MTSSSDSTSRSGADRLASPHGGQDNIGPLARSALPAANKVHLGRFELWRELGRGGFGIVFLAWDPLLRREVALKVPRQGDFLTSAFRRQFLHEARAAAGLDHPGIVPIYEAEEGDGVCYIVSAYCPGINLAQWIEQRTVSVPQREAAALIATLAEAVQYIHERKIWHRDIKPSNVLLQPLDRPGDDGLLFLPRLTDFGLAKLQEAESRHTQTGTVLGTPAYMAPEQAAGRLKEIGPHTDVFALGVILYELLTGQPPFSGATPLEVLRRVSEDAAVPPCRLRSDVSRDLETICLKCLEKETYSRYGSAAELVADLRRYLSGEAVAARPPSLRQRGRKWCLRPERIHSAGMFLLSFGLLFFLWCGGTLAALALGFIQPPRPAALARYLLVHIGLFYVPMMATGWKVLGQSRLALWLGTLTAFAFFLRMFAVGLIWGDWLGRPQPLDMGGMFADDAERVVGNVLFTAASAILCVYCGIALIGSHSQHIQSRQARHQDTSTLPQVENPC